MRLAVLTLCLPVAATAFSQSPTATPAVPSPGGLASFSIALPQPAPLKHPPEIAITVTQQLPRIFLPPVQSTLRDAASTLDPKFVVHPPQSSLGAQPQGTQVALSLYPGLEFLPIADPMPNAEPIPTTWLNAKVESIPIVWPKTRLLPVENGTQGQALVK